MKSLLDRIIASIEIVEKENLSVGLYGGKLGYSILYLLSVLTSGDSLETVPQRVIKYLSSALNDYKSWPKGLLHGNMGALWGLKYLSDKGLIETPKSMKKMAFEIIQYNLLNLYALSSGCTAENEIYPFGITMLPFWDGSESVFRYYLEEKIILHVHECESILKGDIHYSHIQKYLNASHLHSILYFVLQTKEKRISTFKSMQVITMIEDLRTKIKNSNKFDEYILDFLLNIAPQIDMTKMTIEEQLDFLGYIGMFSLLYNSPQLFMMTFDKCKNDNANFIQFLYDKCNTNFVNTKTLIGIGFGLFHLLNNTSDEL